MTLIPKLLLLTTAVIENATNPIVNPLTTKTIKSNQIKAFDQILRSKINPAKQKLILIITTWKK